MATRRSSNHNLKKWVNSAVRAGYSDNDIRRRLLDAGWSRHEAEQAMPHKKPHLDFVFLFAVFIAIAITFVLYVYSSPALQGFLTAGIITGSSVSEAPQKEFRLSASQPKIKIDFAPRVDKKELPTNWFISAYYNADGADKKEWTWAPLDSKKDGLLIVNLGELRRPSSYDAIPRSFIQSKPINNMGEAKYNVSFAYLPEFSGECLQIGMEDYLPDGTPDIVYQLNLNEFGSSTFSNFDYFSQNINGTIFISAVSQSTIPDGHRVVFYIYGLCDGMVYFREFTVEQI